MFGLESGGLGLFNRGLTQDEKFMKAALKEARKAYKIDEVPIGCVIVCDGKIIARGYNCRNKDHCTLSHAEIIAIRKASKKLGDWRLEGCTMYVTLEPCQMCAGALVQARNPRFNHQVEIEQGVMKEECSAILTDFFRELREERRREKEEQEE